jgi:hypothetical protein
MPEPRLYFVESWSVPAQAWVKTRPTINRKANEDLLAMYRLSLGLFAQLWSTRRDGTDLICELELTEGPTPCAMTQH